jgi:hypothetical protein
MPSHLLPLLSSPIALHHPAPTQVAIHSAQLFTLTDTHDGSPAVPLGAIAFADLHVTYHSTRRGNMFVKVCRGACEGAGTQPVAQPR